jgi:hypothetical protein
LSSASLRTPPTCATLNIGMHSIDKIKRSFWGRIEMMLVASGCLFIELGFDEDDKLTRIKPEWEGCGVGGFQL